MTDFARLVIVSDSSDLKATRGELGQLTRAGDQTERKLNAATAKMSAGFKRVAIQAAAFVSAFSSVGAALRASQEITRVTNGFRAMGLSTEEAQAALREVAGIAERTRAPLAATAELYRRVTVAGRDLGASQDDVARFTENVGLALGAAGTPANEAAGALLQLSQAMAGGTVRAEEFNSILEGAFPIAQAAANGIDEAAGSVGRLRQMVIDGEVSSKAFFEAIISQSDALQDSFNQTEVTIAQATTGLGNAFALLASETDQAFGISSGIASGIEFLADNLEIVRGAVLGTAAVVTGMYLPAIVSATGATAAWVASLVTLRGALIATGIGALIVAAGTMIDFMIRLRSATGSWGDALSALGDLASGVWEGIKTSASSIGPALGAVWQDVKASFFILMENLSARWRDFLLLIGGAVSAIPGADGIAGGILDAAAKADAGVTGFMRSANDAEAAAAGLRAEAASLATAGFDKVGEAGAKLSEILKGEKDATTEAAEEAKKLAAALDDIGGGNGVGKASEAAKSVDGLSAATNEMSDTFKRAFANVVSGATSASDALDQMLQSLLNILAQDLSGSIFDKLGGSDIISGILGIFGPGQTTGTGLTVNTPNLLPPPSFAGGGFTGTGSRSGGIDGKGGFEAVLHPNETVIDHTKGGWIGARQVVNNITVNAPPGSDVQEQRRQNSTGGEDLTIIIDRAVSNLARDPGSALSRTLGQNFGLRPATRGR